MGVRWGSLQKFSMLINQYYDKITDIRQKVNKIKTLKNNSDEEEVNNFKDLDLMYKRGQLSKEEYNKQILQRLNPDNKKNKPRKGK